MTLQTALMTADELLRLPRNGNRYELVCGELRTMSPTGTEHSRIAGRLAASLGHYVLTQSLGEIFVTEPGFILATNPDTVRSPDLAFVSAQRLAAAGRVRGFWTGAPDLVLEVISPNDLYTDVDDKIAEWLAAGARLIFVANPRRNTVRVHRPGAAAVELTLADTLDGGDVVPGWSMLVRALFP